MAACSDTEEKPSSSNGTSPLKISSENTVNHEMPKNCTNDNSDPKESESLIKDADFSKLSEADVSKLSEAEFRDLMVEASTFNQPKNKESKLLQQLRVNNPVKDTESCDRLLLKNYSNHNQKSSRSHIRTDGRKKHSRSKDDSSSKNNLNPHALQKTIQQSQSLTDLMSSGLSKTRQKPRKAHRTHSLSSEEVKGIVSDSQSSKKSSKTASSGGSNTTVEVGTKNSIKGSSDTCVESVSVTLDVNNEVSVTKDSPVSVVTSDKKGVQNSRKGALDNTPIEIEMEEIKSDKTSSKDDFSSGSSLEKSENGLAQSNSKFYVDCNDIDTTVTFPLKIVSSASDPNKAIEDFPTSPWASNVTDILNTFHVNPDVYRRDRQLLNADVNGNPFTRNTRPSNLASLVSNSIMEHNPSSLSENKNRKNKRLKNSVNKGVLSENIAGHRGQEDIDALLQYINSSDDNKKVGKTSVKSNSQSQMLSSKATFLHDNDKKKSFGRELKNGNKNIMQNVKKKLTRSNSLENMTSSKLVNDTTDVFDFETRASSSLKDSCSVDFENSVHRTLDINSNEESKYGVEKGKDSSTDESSSRNSVGRSSPEVSSFAADFYSTADVSSQTTEDSGFLIVKKKQRKKHQSKRSDAYRWRNAQAQRKKGMMLPLAESKCGKQDSRRKSTSSMPHSEHSSADNSDLDSVHSLPVRGSVPHPTQPHPHTTPSSSSSTPQASYADIARMPISKLNSPSPCIITYSTQATSVSPPEEKTVPDSTVVGKRRVSGDSREVDRATSESNSDSSSQDVKVRSHAKSTREINTQTEPESLVVQDPTKLDAPASKPAEKKADDAVKVVCSVCDKKKSACACPKSTLLKAKSLDIPPVIMDNIPSESNACNVSFGFGIEEVLEMTPADSASLSDLELKDNNRNAGSKEVDSKGEEKTEKHEGISEISSVNKTADANANSSCKSSSTLDVVSKTVQNKDLSLEQSSHLKTVYFGNGQVLCYKETKVNSKKCNNSELINFLAREFQAVEKEIAGNKNSSKTKYYDASDEA